MASPPHQVDKSSSSVTLCWDEVPGAEAYELQYRRVAGAGVEERKGPEPEEGEWQTVSAKLSGTGVRKKNLEAGAVYCFRVRAQVGGKWGELSSSSARIATLTMEEESSTPNAPAEWQGQTTPTSITVAWDLVEGASKYELQWRPASEEDGCWTTASSGLSGAAARKKGLTPGTGYVFRVRAGRHPGGDAAATLVWGPPSRPSATISTTLPLDASFGRLLGREFVNAKGDTVSLDDLSRGLVFLYFSASWCPPCRQFTPLLAEFYDEQKKRGKQFEVVFVSSDREEEAFWGYFRGHHGPWLALPYHSQARGQAGSYFKVQGIPRLMVFAPSGRTVCDNAVGTPLTSWQFDRWERAAAEA